jgi:hypothetical protein
LCNKVELGEDCFATQFESFEDYETELIHHWFFQERKKILSESSSPNPLIQIVFLVVTGLIVDRHLESAIREWAEVNEHASEVVFRLDILRKQTITELLKNSDERADEIDNLSAAIFSAYTGTIQYLPALADHKKIDFSTKLFPMPTDKKILQKNLKKNIYHPLDKAKVNTKTKKSKAKPE